MAERRVGRRVVIGAAAGVAVGSVLGAFGWRAAPPPPVPEPATTSMATVTMETLVESVTAPGTLAFGPPQPVASRLAGTVTGLPPVGTTVDRGGALFRIDDQPVILMFGELPSYRELAVAPPAEGGTPAPTTEGTDVRQLEENLRALGYRGLTVDRRYTEQTATMVRRWQRDVGLPQTGVVELGRVFVGPGPVRIAEHTLTAGAVATGPVIAVTGTTRLVTATVKAHDREVAKPQAAVQVALPNGKDLTGRVLSVGKPAEEQPNAAQEPTLEVVVALDDQAAVDGLDDGPATVRFVARQRSDVLVVPIGALLALAEGGYGLEVVDGVASRVVAVTTGLFANGKVELTGGEIRQGMSVRMAR